MGKVEPLRAHQAPLELGRAPPRPDHNVVALMVPQGARVLEIGCGDGALMAKLSRERAAKCRGMEMNQSAVNACVTRGLSVVQGDADHDLSDYPDASFDIVVLSRVIDKVRSPRAVLKQAARIGERAIVSFANFGHWRLRRHFLFSGRLPVTQPGPWWNSEALHPCTVRDFAELADDLRLCIERAVPLSHGQPGAPFARRRWRPNWFAEEAVFLLKKL